MSMPITSMNLIAFHLKLAAPFKVSTATAAAADARPTWSWCTVLWLLKLAALGLSTRHVKMLFAADSNTGSGK